MLSYNRINDNSIYANCIIIIGILMLIPVEFKRNISLGVILIVIAVLSCMNCLAMGLYNNNSNDNSNNNSNNNFNDNSNNNSNDNSNNNSNDNSNNNSNDNSNNNSNDNSNNNSNDNSNNV